MTDHTGEQRLRAVADITAEFARLHQRIAALEAENERLRATTAQEVRQEAVHWRAVLSPAEVPMQLNVHEHVAGFTDRRKAEDWIAARLDMDGWHYTLEALYPGPQPGPDVRALVEAGNPLSNVAYNLAQKPGHALTEFDCELLLKLRKRWDEAARAHRQAQRKGESHDN
ncbi:hypothetical protein NDO41_07955 [Ectopseudomonas mendocina]|nr:hypothetical protein NDO41_07955 [Pseudomonas mendocina]